jgi:hypothetical protein
MHREESVPEQMRSGLPGHEEYEALAALAAGGRLEGAEFNDFRTHLKDCSECRADYQEFRGLVTQALPQAQGTFRQKLAEILTRPAEYSRERFLRRARAEGVVFPSQVEAPARSSSWYLRPSAVLAPIAAVAVVAIGLSAYRLGDTPHTAQPTDAASAQQLTELKGQNAALIASLSRLNDSLAHDQREISNLRSQLGSESQRRGAATSSSQNAQLLDEARDQEKLLAAAKDEAARINQLRVDDEASLVEQQARITELSYKLRIASATLDQERQLAAAGKDVRELIASRQLHVIDVRDTDPNGNPREAFGRVFLTEGKSLTFYAFDLNQDSGVQAKSSFQVWAVPEAGKSVPRSLGSLHLDAKAQGRWVLRVEKPDLVKEISSVFVTVEPTAGGKQPSGEKMLYAYLGEANHP